MLNLFKTYLLSKVDNEKGQGMVEYALIIGLIAVVVIGVLTTMGTDIQAKFNQIIGSL